MIEMHVEQEMKKENRNEEKRELLYMGLDLGYETAMVSFLSPGQKDPVTVSTKPDPDSFRIPLNLYVGRQDYYLYGTEASRKHADKRGILYEQLYLRALDQIHTDGAGEAAERLAVFIRRLIRLRERLGLTGDYEMHLAIAVPDLTEDAVDVLRMLASELAQDVASVCWMDYGESFFYYTFHQEPSIWAHDVAMFDFSRFQVRFTLLVRESRTIPQIVVSGEKIWEVPELVHHSGKEKDLFFASVLREAFAKRIISGVYLLGDGFDGEWLSDTLRVLGPNRRVFMGKNLYTKGAAFAALVRQQPNRWQYVYDCKYKVQANVSIKVLASGVQKFLPVVVAGENWYDVQKNFDVLLKGTTQVDLWIQKRGARSARIQPLVFEDVWKRAEKTRKIRLTFEMKNEQILRVYVMDLGFGAFFPSTQKQWEFEVELW